MNTLRIAPLILCIALLAACEEIDPSKPLKTEPTRVDLREIPNADVWGTVRDQDGTPLPDVRISLGIGEQARTAVTAGDGFYHLLYLAAGGYVITASREGYVPGRARVTLEGEDVSGADIVLTAYRAAASHHAEAVEVGESGALVQTHTIRSTFPTSIEQIPSVELQLVKGTVLRDVSGQVATSPVEVGVTPISGRSLVAPEPGTFGVTEADVEVVPGEHTAVRVNVDLGKGGVAEDVEIEEPNPMLRTGARARFAHPLASFVLEPEGLVLENPDGTRHAQPVIFGNLPLGGLLSPGAAVDLVDRDGNILKGTIGADGQSIEADISRLTRYDLLIKLQVEVVETTLHVGDASEQAKLAKTAQVIIELDDGTTFLFPQLDDAEFAGILVSNILPLLMGSSCKPSKGPKDKEADFPETSAHSRIEIRVVEQIGDKDPWLETFAIVNRWVCPPKEFTVVHEEGEVE